MRILLLVLALFLFAGNARAIHVRDDTVFLLHNEMLTGSVKEMKLGKVTIDTKNVGLIDIKISKIESISTSSDTFRIETADQILYYGVLKSAPEKGFVYIVTPSHTRHIAINHISTMLPILKAFKNRFQGNLSSGFSYTQSSRIGQLNLNTNIDYITKQVTISLTGSGNASIDTSVFSIDRADFGLAGYYNLKYYSKWYIFGQFNYQRNLELSIARRYQQTLGGGQKFILGYNTQILGMLGVSLNQELSSNNEESLLVEIPLGFMLNFFKFSHSNTQISSENVFYTSLSQKGRIRYEMNTNISWELNRDFSLSLTFYYSYDRKPPDPNAGKNDFGTTIGLSYKL